MTDKPEETDSMHLKNEKLGAALDDFTNLSISHAQETSKIPFGISTSEFYYGLGLPNIEKAAVSTRVKTLEVAKTKKRERGKKKKMEKTEMKVILKTAQKELKNLTITVKNEPGPTGPSKKASKNVQKLPENDTNPLLARLKLLQRGQITSEDLQKTTPLQMPKKKAIIKEDEIQRNKEEVQRLNSQIQNKISHQIKPKLRDIIDRPIQNSCNGTTQHFEPSKAVQSPQAVAKPRITQKQTRDVPIVKTSVKLSDEEVEIYRYSQDDLNQLQSSATWELVPRLQQLKICSSVNSELDSFILKLLSITDETERQSAIFDEAEKRLFIKRSGPTTFEYNHVKKTVEAADRFERISTKLCSEDSKLLQIESFKSIAKSDDELNEMAYRLEFMDLFRSVLKDQDFKKQPTPEIVKHLVDSNQAFILDGEIRVNARNNQEAYVSHPKGKRDVCISKLILRKCAFQGDFVRILVRNMENEDLNTSSEMTDDDLDTSQVGASDANRNFGCVLEILEKRHSRRVIGSISQLTGADKKHKRHVSFNVRDTKVPNVRIGRDGIPRDVELSDKMLMVVEITGWSHDQPKGKIVEIIGEKGQLKAENAAILQQHNLHPEPFSQEILDQLPKEPFEIPVEEFKYREDLRKKCIFSIDPETARDLDDALSCEVLPNGNLEVGVHISDVTYFLKENSEMDDIVKEKATTIYLVDMVYHMLPVPLCMLCSLLPGADKMAYSVFWEMNPETAEIINTRFTRSVVNSCAKLSYDHAQIVIEKENLDWTELEKEFPEVYNGFTVSDIANVIVKLQKLAVIMRTKRKENGALKIDQPKISFKFDKDDQRMEAPVEFFQYCTKDSNRLIEEFMLLANISVAKFIYEKFPDISLLRQHDPPNATGLEKLKKNLQKQGLLIETGSSTSLSDSMERLISTANETAGMNSALNLLVSKTMSRARYFCSETATDESGFWHFALSIPIYTHFTSPIRRYADCLVHRVLNAALGYESPPSRTPEEVQNLANICNAQKYNAKLAGEDSSNLYFMQFIRSLKKKTMMASVVGIFDYNLEVVLVDTGHVVKVYYKNLERCDSINVRAFTEMSPPCMTASWPRLNVPSLKIQFGSLIMVEVEVSKDKLIINRMFYHRD